MIYIKALTPAQAWRQSVQMLYKLGSFSQDKEFYRYDTAVIEVADTRSQERYDELFPMSRQDVDIISNFLVTGEGKELVVHDWTKIYRERLFENNNQVEKLINYLSTKPAGKKAQASIWSQEIDLTAAIAPCLQIIWCQIVENKLELHAHLRATDCYGKLLMNINEFIALQNYIAKKLDVALGSYIQFIDSLHFNLADKEKVEVLVKKIMDS